MKNLLHIIATIVLLCSCSEKEELLSPTDWQNELIGVGYLGDNPDSLSVLFSYFPHSGKQPDQLKGCYKLYPKISGDTITIQNSLLYDLFSNSDKINAISQDFSRFLIGREEKLYKFTKITGHRIIPDVLYLKKYPNNYPEKFKYQVFDGMDALDSYTIEINGKDSIKVWLKGSPYHPYIFEQYKKSEVDDLFIGSYLNLICDNRYDTMTFEGVIFCGVIMDELLVYNDSIFDYSTYFRRIPDGGLLLDYFRSKIDKKAHSIDEFDLDQNCPFEPRKFNNIPVAIENWEILAPPPPN